MQHDDLPPACDPPVVAHRDEASPRLALLHSAGLVLHSASSAAAKRERGSTLTIGEQRPSHKHKKAGAITLGAVPSPASAPVTAAVGQGSGRVSPSKGRRRPGRRAPENDGDEGGGGAGGGGDGQDNSDGSEFSSSPAVATKQAKDTAYQQADINDAEAMLMSSSSSASLSSSSASFSPVVQTKNESDKSEKSDSRGEREAEDEKELRRKKVEELRRIVERESQRPKWASSSGVRTPRSASNSSSNSMEILITVTEPEERDPPPEKTNKTDESEQPYAQSGITKLPIIKGAGQRGSIIVLDDDAEHIHTLLQEQHQLMLKEREEEKHKQDTDNKSEDGEILSTSREDILHLRKQVEELTATNLALTRGSSSRLTC